MEELKDRTEMNTQATPKAGRSALQRVARLFILLFVLWIGLLALVRLILSPSVLERLIDRYAAEYVDGKISTGRVSLSVFRHFPSIGLDIDEFSLTYPAQKFDSLASGTDTLASFRKFSVQLNLPSLLRGSINIPYAELSGPRIFARRFDDGRANWGIISLPSDTTESQTSLPKLKAGKICLSGNPLLSYSDSRDSIYLSLGLRELSLDGSKDLMQIQAEADAALKTGLSEKIDIPIELSMGLKLPKDSIPAFIISGLNAEVAAIPLVGEADIRMHSDRLRVKASAVSEACPAGEVMEGIVGKIIPEISQISTDASISLSVGCEGDYVYADGSLPDFDVKLEIPESEILLKKAGEALVMKLKAAAIKENGGPVTAAIERAEVRCKGLELEFSGKIPDILDQDLLIEMDGSMSADLGQLGRFVPDSVGLISSGKLSASLKGSIRQSQLDIYRFSESTLKGGFSGEDICLRIPEDSLHVDIDRIDIALEPETMRSRIDKDLEVRLMAIQAMVGKASLEYGRMGLSGERVNFSAKSSAESDTSKVSRLGGRVNAAGIVLTDASGVEVELRGSENGFQMIPKKDRPEVPLLSFNSTNDRIMLKDGINRVILTDASLGATAAMNTVERRQRIKAFVDSLARLYPDVPRDSLMFHARSRRQAHKVPEWMTEEDFKKKDIDIKLDKTLAKYFREWDLKGQIDVRTGILMTPYFPIRNILRGFELTFDNNRIGIDSAKIRSGSSEIAAKGELTGLRRALLGRGGLDLDLDISSDKVDANELLTAYNNGSRYVPPQDKEAAAEATDAEFFKMVTSDSLSVNDSITPLIVIPSNLNADIRLNASDITYSDLNISGMHSELTMKERCVQIRNSEAVSNMGDISFEGFYATRSKKNIQVGFSFNFKDISAEKVIDMMPAVDSLMPLLRSFKGQLDCELAATAGIDTCMNVITPSINGIIRITGKDLSIKDSDMFRDLAKKLMFKNKSEGYIKEMSVEGVISDSMLEVFPFILKLDRYTLALSGVHNMDESFRYHASLLKSPFVIRLGVDIYGDNFDDMRFKIGKAKYKSTNIPVFSAVIDTTKINLVRSIRSIFEKGVDAAVTENERREAIEKHKEDIGYIRAVDQQLEALTKKEEEQMKAEEAALKEQEEAQEALKKAVQQITETEKNENKKQQ